MPQYVEAAVQNANPSTNTNTHMCSHAHTYKYIHTYTEQQASLYEYFVCLSKLFTHFESEHILQRISILPRNKRQAEHAVQAEEEEADGEEEQAAQG